MHWGGPFFIIAIIAITTAGWVMNNWIRAKHGYEPTSDWGGFGGRTHGHIGRHFRGFGTGPNGDIDDARKIMLLTADNEKLSGQVGRLEERIAVLERIATDPAERTARDIDALRDR